MGNVTKIEKNAKKAFAKKTACYVLITCSEPDADGKMEVELNYDGDEVLAAFLIDNAAQVFESSTNRRESK